MKVIFDGVALLLEQSHEVIRYSNAASLLADRAAIARADVLFVPSDFPCTAAVMDRAPRLRALVSAVTGIEGFDRSAASQRGIVIANGAAAENYESMAEATIMLILNLCYDLDGTRDNLRRSLPRPERVRAQMLRRKTVGLIGFGRIARAVATRLSAWDVTLLAYAPRRAPPLENGVNKVEFDELLKSSDVISVHLSLNDETRGMLGAERLRAMKPGAFLVNTARGGIVDEAALCELLHAGRLAGAAIDTFADEPLPAASPLRSAPNLILTPHLVGHTREAHDALIPVGFENITRPLRGELPLIVANPEAIPLWNKRWGGNVAPTHCTA